MLREDDIFDFATDLSITRAELDDIVKHNSIALNSFAVQLTKEHSRNSAAGKDAVFVGRIRRDFSAENTLNLCCVSDNLRKSAALNAIQIAQEMVKRNSVRVQ